jgi:hypothetical protein
MTNEELCEYVNEMREASIDRVRERLAIFNDRVADVAAEILEVSKTSTDPEIDEALPPLFRELTKREGERDHARAMLTAMEASR